MEVSRPDVPPVHFAPSRGARLAYQMFGQGTETIVAIPPLAQHIEMAWERVEIRRMLERFGSFSTYLHFDKRGTGASDRTSRVPGIDERVGDLEAVMDHAGVDSAHLYACSEGGPMAILFAATYPDRVRSLTFFGSCASHLPPDASDRQVAAIREVHASFAERWGTPDSPVAEGFAPSLSDTPGFRAWHARYERSAAGADSLLDLLELTLEMDVRELLPGLDVPTLVIHRRGDRVVPVESGRELARMIPGAVMFEQDGEDHFGYAGDVAGWMDEVERFVTGSISEDASHRHLPKVRINTLGRFSVTRDGVEVPTSEWGSRVARQICKRLVAHRGWPVSRDELMDMCWPDESDLSKLSARLSVQLSTVRRMIGGAVVADRSTVRLDLGRVATDLEELYRASTDDAIVAAYPGEFLPGDRYEDWTSATREEARARFRKAARNLARSHGDRGDHEGAARLARRLIAEDRFDHQAHRLHVVSLLAAGEPGAARTAHGAWEQAMTEIGYEVAPIEDLAS